jgi:hypothetical protein
MVPLLSVSRDSSLRRRLRRFDIQIPAQRSIVDVAR